MNTGIIHNNIYMTQEQSQIQSHILPSTASNPPTFIINIPNTQNQMTPRQIPNLLNIATSNTPNIILQQTQQNIAQPSQPQLSQPGCYSSNILIGNGTNVFPGMQTLHILNAQQSQQSMPHYTTHSIPTNTNYYIVYPQDATMNMAQTYQNAPNQVITHTFTQLDNPTRAQVPISTTNINGNVTSTHISNANISASMNHNLNLTNDILYDSAPQSSMSTSPRLITPSQPALVLTNSSSPNATVNLPASHFTPSPSPQPKQSQVITHAFTQLDNQTQAQVPLSTTNINGNVTSTSNFNPTHISNATISAPMNHNLNLNNDSLYDSASQSSHFTPSPSPQPNQSQVVNLTASTSNSINMGTTTLPNISVSLPPTDPVINQSSAVPIMTNVALNQSHSVSATNNMNIEMVKGFACKYCSKRFNRKSNMKKHTLIHTGTRMFKCSYCPKSFIQKHTYVAIIDFLLYMFWSKWIYRILTEFVHFHCIYIDLFIMSELILAKDHMNVSFVTRNLK